MTQEDKSSQSQSMLSRFAGEEGEALLLVVLREIPLLEGVADLESLLAISDKLELPAETVLIEQGAADNDVYLVVSGAFRIHVNSRLVTTRGVGSTLGEMALIDPTARRSANVVAAEPSLVLKCSEASFSKFANSHPQVWRRLAVELGRRLTERNRFITVPREQPVLFLGCSKEGLEPAQEIQSGLDHDPIVVEVWTDGVFNASKTPIEDLNALVRRIDFGALILTPDDMIVSRGEEAFGPRDNVIFELGLIMGAIGRERTFMIAPRGEDFKLPTDLLGVKPLDYAAGDEETIRARLGPTCNELRKAINNLGPL